MDKTEGGGLAFGIIGIMQYTIKDLDLSSW